MSACQPTVDFVDTFVKVGFKTVPANGRWVIFHCREQEEGTGRSHLPLAGRHAKVEHKNWVGKLKEINRRNIGNIKQLFSEAGTKMWFTARKVRVSYKRGLLAISF